MQQCVQLCLYYIKQREGWGRWQLAVHCVEDEMNDFYFVELEDVRVQSPLSLVPNPYRMIQ